MRELKWLVVFLFVALAFGKAEEACLKNITENTFGMLFENPEKAWLIKVYTNWCGHCKRLAPVWEEVALLLCNNASIGVGQIDGEADSAASSQFEVDGYPTILLLKNNRTYIYDGERTISQIIDFATKNYVHAPAFNFTGPKTFTERFSTGVVHVFGAFAMITNALGLSFLPFWVKGTLPLLLLLSPIIGIILCIIFVPDDPIPQKKEEHEKTE
eukprot:TRINITY_DN11423_c0_g1_i20.p1 TRINITY_DN11423_c0_g1~~TRINITY_DN11423_c0_g1_i20.p1  ORF type:complete len:214 (-),score=50.00 TRINITY_DN11423_c0_g1_i20:69-710(-)